MAQQPQLNTLARLPNAAHDIVAVATSLSGLGALSQILYALPVKQAEEAGRLRPGAVYIAPPNKHLLVNGDGILTLSDTARVHFCRPAASNLFESVAKSFKTRAIAVVLTGVDSDGAAGTSAIKQMGDTVIAQDELNSKSFSMPSAAINTGSVDFVLPLTEIASTLVSLVMTEKAA